MPFDGTPPFIPWDYRLRQASITGVFTDVKGNTAYTWKETQADPIAAGTTDLIAGGGSDFNQTAPAYEVSGQTISASAYPFNVILYPRCNDSGTQIYQFEAPAQVVVPDIPGAGVLIYASGSLVGAEPGINFITGTNIGLTIADMTGSSYVNVTVALATNPTFSGTVTYSSTYVGVYQSGSSTTYQSGSTTTYSSGSTLVMTGPTWNMTGSTTTTISTGQTWTIAGPGSLVISAPVTLSGYLQTGYQTLTYSTQQNNIVLTANTLILQPSAGSLNVTGFGKPATGTSPTVTIINESAFPVPLTNNDAASSSGNRTTCPGAATYYLQAADRIQITYDPVGSCWRLGDGTIASATAVGQVPIGNSTGGYTNATLTAGSGITITDSSGAVTIAATGSGGTPSLVAGISAMTGLVGVVSWVISGTTYYSPLYSTYVTSG